MQHRGMVAGAALAVVLGWGSPATAGWVVDQAVKGAGHEGRQQILVQANRMKTVSLGPDGRPTHAFIVDLNAETLTQVDYGERHYVTATLQEYVQTMTGAAQAAAGHMAEARKQMEQALKDMPPEQRKMMEQMMRQQMPQGGGPGAGECVEPRREIRKTGQQATIAGFPAVRWEVLADGRMQSEVWVAPSLGVARELDARKLEQFGAAMSKVSACGPGEGAGRGADPGWKLAAEGYPVRTVMPGAGGTTMEVVKAESRAVPATEFQPPAGFARKTLRELMGQ
ncbi:MAG: DUF4412 domain-containing protein [Candidatus Rokubacteria bacterium]|nr:DUF4412 domain-containing protein [Candidatus Rokubacteria bacterium]